MMTAVSIPVGEPLFATELRFTGIGEYGVSLQDLNSGRVGPPPAGARIDLTFFGTIAGPRLRGVLEGVDHVVVRADGRFRLDIHARITTHDGAAIALTADGIAQPTGDSTVALRMQGHLTTGAPSYAWLNQGQVWLHGRANMRDGTLRWTAWAS
jgi:hypothetical protein